MAALLGLICLPAREALYSGLFSYPGPLLLSGQYAFCYAYFKRRTYLRVRRRAR